MSKRATAMGLDASGATYNSLESSAQDYIELMKPRVLMLVVFTAFCGILVAPGHIHPLTALCAVVFVSIGAGASAAINMWYDVDIDAIMERTKNRPLVRGSIHPDEALAFGVILAVISVIGMALCVNLVASFLLAVAILYYVLIYTMWLKRSSIQNVVIGGVPGALPPMIGWAAVSNDISWQSFTLFLIIFIWTPPHSWALALFRLQDYTKSRVPMMPVVKGIAYTTKQILFYSIILCFTIVMPYILGTVNIWYIVPSLLLTIYFLYLAIILARVNNYAGGKYNDDDSYQKIKFYSKKLFWYSIIYLFIIFLLLVVCSRTLGFNP